MPPRARPQGPGGLRLTQLSRISGARRDAPPDAPSASSEGSELWGSPQFSPDSSGIILSPRC